MTHFVRLSRPVPATGQSKLRLLRYLPSGWLKLDLDDWRKEYLLEVLLTAFKCLKPTDK